MAFEEANDAVVSERSIFSEIRIIKFFSLFHGIHIWGSNTLGGKNKLITYTHIHIHTQTRVKYGNPCCTCMPRGLIISLSISHATKIVLG